jgi:hypothetical protein
VLVAELHGFMQKVCEVSGLKLELADDGTERLDSQCELVWIGGHVLDAAMVSRE